MADPFEIDLEVEPNAQPNLDPKTVSVQGDGEGNLGSEPKQITDEDILVLQRELQAAKDEAKAARSQVQAHAVARTEAETKVQQTESRLTGEVAERLNAQEATINTALAGAQGELEALRSTIASLQQDGKFLDAAEAIENLADAKQRVRELTSQKAQIDAYREQAKRTPQQPSQQVGSRTQAWIAAHPRFQSDRVYYAKAMLAHEQAIQQNLAPDTDPYFEFIETELGERQRVTDDKSPKSAAAEPVVPATPVAKSPAVAPVRPHNGNGGNGTAPRPSQKIMLSGEEVELADSLFGDSSVPSMYIKDPKERYTYFYGQKGKKSAGSAS